MVTAALGRQEQVDLSSLSSGQPRPERNSVGVGGDQKCFFFFFRLITKDSWTSIVPAPIRIENEAIQYHSLHEV